MPSLIDLLTAHKKNTKDKKVFGLVIQGGGMRAVYSAAVLAALVEYGFSDTFDHVIGSSAGGLNGAYFIAGQADAVDSYTDDLTTKNFVNLARIDKRVDIDYVIDVALQQKRPLNIANLQRSHSQLHIVLTDEKSGLKEVVSDHKRFKEIYEELRATAALPILYDKVVPLNKGLYVDGGVSDILPIDVAINLGCTNIVVIMTRQVSSYVFDVRHKKLVKQIMYYLGRNHSKALRNVLPTNEKVLKRNLQIATLPPRGIKVYLIQPSDEEALVSLGTIDKEKIEELARLGAKDAEIFLHQSIY